VSSIGLIAGGRRRTPAVVFPDPAGVSGAVLWLRAEDLLLANNAPVTAWPARVGPTLYPSETYRQPTFISSGPGSKPTVAWGLDAMIASAFTWPANYTMFVVEDMDAYQAGVGSIGGDDFSANRYFQSVRNSDSSIQHISFRSGSNLDTATVTPPGGAASLVAPGISAAFRSAGTLKAYWNNYSGAEASPVATGRTGSMQLTLGANANPSGGFWPGQISEVLIFGRALSETEIDAVYNMLAARYGILSAAPSTYTETFTGTDNDPWPAGWLNASTAAAATAKIAGNAGRIALPSTFGRKGMYFHNIAPKLDWDLLASFTYSNTSLSAVLTIQDDGSTRAGTEGNNCYSLVLSCKPTSTAGEGYFNRLKDGTTTSLNQRFNLTFLPLTKYNVRVKRVTNPTTGVVTVSYKVWDASVAEPASWTYSTTDSTPLTTPGRIRLGASSNNAGYYVDFDDVVAA
jgi:hypothetical protein